MAHPKKYGGSQGLQITGRAVNLLLSKNKNTRYMKTFSILLLAATAVHAAATADVTALTVAFILFCRECGEDVQRIWNGWINEKGRA